MASLPGDPRNTAEYRRNAALILADSDQCHLCGHHGARTADHLTTIKDWLRLHGTLDGVNHTRNLAPAHGSGAVPPNRCLECVILGRSGLCNQTRGALTLVPEPRSRDW